MMDLPKNKHLIINYENQSEKANQHMTDPYHSKKQWRYRKILFDKPFHELQP
jgi:hypothetical protein